MFKKILIAVSVILAMLSLSVFAADFPDVVENKQAIEALHSLEVIGGYEDGTFRPNDYVQRDEMAKIIFVLQTTLKDAGDGVTSFPDVDKNHWGKGYISYAANKNIIGGYEDGTFRPDNFVTYDEALKMVCGVLGYTDWNSNLWPIDVRQKGLTKLKLGEGIDAKGSDYLTRAEVALLAYNALDADMNETKSEITQIGNLTITTSVPKTLKADVWNINDETNKVESIKEDILVLDNGEEVEYIGANEMMVGCSLVSLTRNNKVISNYFINTPIEVEYTYNKKEDKYYIGKIEVDKPAIDIEKPYLAYAIYEDDETISEIKEANLEAYEIVSVKKDEIKYKKLNGTSTEVGTFTTDVKEKDIILAAPIFDTHIVVPHTVTIGKAVKYNKDYIVLDNGTKLIHTNLTDDCLGKEGTYYSYNGEIFYTTDVETVEDKPNFAILQYIKGGKEELNPITMSYEVIYTAYLVVNGKEVSVTVATINDDTNFADYGYITGSPIQYRNILVTYEVNDDGLYELETAKTDVPAGSVFKYNPTTGLYTVGNNNKVIVTDNTLVYNIVESEEIGGFMTVGYPKIDKEFKDTITISDAYLYELDNGLWELAAVAIGDFELVVEDKTTPAVKVLKSSSALVDGEYEYEFFDGTVGYSDKAGETYGFYVYNTVTEYYVEFNGTLEIETFTDFIEAEKMVVFTDKSTDGFVVDNAKIWSVDEDENIIEVAVEDIVENSKLIIFYEDDEVVEIIVEKYNYENEDGEEVISDSAKMFN